MFACLIGGLLACTFVIAGVLIFVLVVLLGFGLDIAVVFDVCGCFWLLVVLAGFMDSFFYNCLLLCGVCLCFAFACWLRSGWLS